MFGLRKNPAQGATTGMGLVNGPYAYIAGPDTLGIGVDNLAFVRPGYPVDEPIYGHRYNVQRVFAPFLGAAQFPLANIGPTTDLRAGGVYLSGGLALQVLTEYNKDNNLS